MKKPPLVNWLFDLLRLNYEKEDPAVVQEQIEKAIVFKGTNIWILIFAILVASVGLNMNSTAVVIGAMLISPLMGPINGVGYAVATYNFNLLQRSLKNLSFAVGAALSASTLYFLLTPIHSEHSELLARTTPTIYDVFIALFGGLAGVVALSSKNKGNVIPGVAIATALMPPICTAGYGIAVGKLEFFLGASYLFLINSVFIALASLIVTQVLGYPKKTQLLNREIKNKNIAIAVLLTITVLPSIYLGYTFVKRERFNIASDQFIQHVRRWEGNYLLDKTVDTKSKEITLVYAGNPLDSASINYLRQEAVVFGLKDAKITVRQGLSVNELPAPSQVAPDRSGEVQMLKIELMLKDRTIDSLRNIDKQGEQLLREAKVLFPSIHGVSYADTRHYVDSIAVSSQGVLVVFDVDTTITEDDKAKIKDWLTNRLNTKNIKVKF